MTELLMVLRSRMTRDVTDVEKRALELACASTPERDPKRVEGLAHAEWAAANHEDNPERWNRARGYFLLLNAVA